MGSREDAGYPNEGGDKNGFQFRIGFHPGVVDKLPRVAVAPTAASTTRRAAAPAPAPANRPPTVKASCNPCTVPVGQTATVTADAQDPDGDPLTYQWKCAAGTRGVPDQRAVALDRADEPGSRAVHGDCQ